MNIKTESLNHYLTRPISDNLVDLLKADIEQNGYYGLSMLVVGQKDDEYFVLCGNHRLTAARDLDIKELPCTVIDADEDDWLRLAIRDNEVNKTLKQDDLFDWLFRIGKEKERGLTQVQIGERVGWGEGKVMQYSALILNTLTEVLDMAKAIQTGRVSQSLTSVSFNFTEGWFRNSGIYGLDEKYQTALMQGFISDGCKWKKEKVQKESAKYKSWQVFAAIAEAELVNADDLPGLLSLIENNSFRNDVQVRDKIKNLNDKAKNRLVCGDCLEVLFDLPDASIDLVITDPPYGIDYSSNRSQFKEHVTKEKISNDSELAETLALFDDVCELLDKKTKTDAHLYFFTSWKVYSEFESIVKKRFKIKNMIVWDKGNHGAGDLTHAWGNRHELVIFATKGARPVNKRLDDIQAFSKVNSQAAIHPTQKPVQLLSTILSVSAQQADVVCDPFMGSGSTIKAAKDHGGLSYIGIELDRGVFEKAKAFIGQ